MDEQPQYVTERVNDALANDAQVAALGLRARVADHDIYLQGEVATEERRERAGEIVRALLPDYEVHNDLSVAECLDPANEERLA
jgi:osmotically-inducible protein OsmY